MARITLSSEEVAPGVLPPCCIARGAPTEDAVPTWLSWVPAWGYFLLAWGILPFVVVYLVTRRAMLVHAPVCGRHRWHFWRRQWLLPAGLAATLLALLSPVLLEPDARPFPPTWALGATAALFAGTSWQPSGCAAPGCGSSAWAVMRSP